LNSLRSLLTGMVKQIIENNNSGCYESIKLSSR
jgi:hypothetical protein